MPARYGDDEMRSAAEPLHRTRFRLSYADCDPSGGVHSATYHQWMERTHIEWWFLQGVWFDELPEQYGITVVARAANAEFLYPLRLFDLVECRMYNEHIGRTSFTQRFEFHSEVGQHTAQASMSLVCVDLAKRPAPVPEHMRARLASTGKPSGIASTARPPDPTGAGNFAEAEHVLWGH